MARKEAQVEAQSKIRLKVRGYDNKLVDNSCRQIVDAAERENAAVVGPIPLPTETKRYTVNRSTFVHKDSRDQFELRVHKRLIDIMNPPQSMVESLSSLNLPAGVNIEIRVA